MTGWLKMMRSRGKQPVVWLGGVLLLGLLMSGCMNVETTVTLYENEQWQASQTVELSADVAALIEDGDESVAELTQQLNEVEAVAQSQPAVVTTNRVDNNDGSMTVTTTGTGQGYEQLNQLFFNGQADFSVELVEGTPQVTINAMDIGSMELVEAGGSNLVRIGGDRIIESNADQIQLNNRAIWQNPQELALTVTEVAGPPPAAISQNIQLAAPPAGAGDGNGNGNGAEEAPLEEVDVIQNGDFEQMWEPQSGAAPHWSPYSNGKAFVGWYDEQWPEAVRSGEHAQLLEIDEVEGNNLDRVIAIFQTVDVAPEAEYELTIHAIMRSDAPIDLRNNFEYEMQWGLDRFGEGDIGNVEEWLYMPLTEQLRIGSNGEFPEDVPLFYERITDTIRTGPDTNRLTLFIRGIKKFPTGTEVNFNVDDVSLVGPPPGAEMPAVQAEQAPASQSESAATMPPAEESNLPSTGIELSRSASVGVFTVGGLLLVVLGVAATASLLDRRRRL